MFVINSEDDFTQLTYLLYEWISEPIEVCAQVLNVMLTRDPCE